MTTPRKTTYADDVQGSHVGRHADNRRVRDKRAWRNTKAGIATRLLMMVVRLAVIPLSIRILGPDRYGLWQACYAFTNWFGLAEGGLGLGLLNSIASAAGADNYDAMRRSVSTAAAALVLVGFLVSTTVVSVAIVPGAPAIFGVSPDSALAGDARLLLAASGILFGATLALSVVQQTYVGLQEGYALAPSILAGGFASVAALFIVSFFRGGPLCTGGPAVIANLVLGRFLFKWHHPELRPSLALVSRATLLSLFSVGGYALLMNLGEMALVQGASVLIANRLGPGAVTPFSVTFSLLYFGFALSNTFVQPLWPAYAEAATRRDAEWIRRAFRRTTRLALLSMSAIAGGVIVLGRSVIYYWAGERAVPTWPVLVLLATYFCVWQAGSCVGTLANGLGLFRLRTIMLGVTGLGYLASTWLLLPVVGVITVPIVGMSLLAIEALVAGTQARRVLSRMRRSTNSVAPALG